LEVTIARSRVELEIPWETLVQDEEREMALKQRKRDLIQEKVGIL
jgi:hypothetical protein